ncbi:class F sortase [Leifsonia sp. NPDC056665]|uniref:class F sortase n=1 Tax=Leifsonia sp. NPDC056665 TaxID=3345901 RepID=UPI003687D6FA
MSTYLSQQSYPKDMRGNPVILPPPSTAVQEKTNAVSHVKAMTLRVPSAGLTVPLGELNDVDGVIDPPGFASAYLVRNYGANLTNAAKGTVFAVMHSCRGGAVCPGNYLINVNSGTAAVAPGADIYLGTLHYRVIGSEKVYKPNVHLETNIWANTPGRLVLLTCLQVPNQTASIDNMVITAQLVTSGVGE